VCPAITRELSGSPQNRPNWLPFKSASTIIGQIAEFKRSGSALVSHAIIRSMLQLHSGRMNVTTLWNAAHIAFAAERTAA